MTELIKCECGCDNVFVLDGIDGFQVWCAKCGKMNYGYTTGAETGNRKEKIKPKRWWVDKIIKSCKTNYDIPIFMKESLSPTMQQFMRRELPDEIIEMEV